MNPLRTGVGPTATDGLQTSYGVEFANPNGSCPHQGWWANMDESVCYQSLDECRKSRSGRCQQR